MLTLMKSSAELQISKQEAFGKGETLDDVYRVRYPLYKKYADITVSMELSSIETTVDAIVEKLKLEKQN